LAQTPAPAAAPASGPIVLEVAPGTRAGYRAQEQLAGINFPNEAVGLTETVTGSLRILPDGSIDSTQSKLAIDLRTLKSDQDNRDNYLRTRTFETDKFPMAEFVPRRIQGVPSPLPATGQAGFQLVGDMTIRGVTSEVTWNGVATFVGQIVAGRATTTVNFAKFSLPKPQLARVLSVEDNIRLEIDFRLRRGS
jgi:polyisoprenoid-binding protein YceI